MAKTAYIQVSTEGQNTPRQREMNIDRYFEEKVSGKNIKDCPELQRTMEYVREGDIDTTTPMGNPVFSVFSSLAEFERETIRQRQEEGKYKGRARKIIDESTFESPNDRWQEGEIQKKYTSLTHSILKAVFDRFIVTF